jgi:hypothetical protein
MPELQTLAIVMIVLAPIFVTVAWGILSVLFGFDLGGVFRMTRLF